MDKLQNILMKWMNYTKMLHNWDNVIMQAHSKSLQSGPLFSTLTLSRGHARTCFKDSVSVWDFNFLKYVDTCY
jgi:hypothetical protein